MPLSLSTLRALQNPARPADTHPELRDALTDAQKQRPQRRNLNAHGELGWIAYERDVMVDATTALLVRHELPIDAAQVRVAVERAEGRAQGHVDYTSKWALGCAEHIAAIASTATDREEVGG